MEDEIGLSTPTTKDFESLPNLTDEDIKSGFQKIKGILATLNPFLLSSTNDIIKEICPKGSGVQIHYNEGEHPYKNSQKFGHLYSKFEQAQNNLLRPSIETLFFYLARDWMYVKSEFFPVITFSDKTESAKYVDQKFLISISFGTMNGKCEHLQFKVHTNHRSAGQNYHSWSKFFIHRINSRYSARKHINSQKINQPQPINDNNNDNLNNYRSNLNENNSKKRNSNTLRKYDSIDSYDEDDEIINEINQKNSNENSNNNDEINVVDDKYLEVRNGLPYSDVIRDEFLKTHDVYYRGYVMSLYDFLHYTKLCFSYFINHWKLQDINAKVHELTRKSKLVLSNSKHKKTPTAFLKRVDEILLSSIELPKPYPIKKDKKMKQKNKNNSSSEDLELSDSNSDISKRPKIITRATTRGYGRNFNEYDSSIQDTNITQSSNSFDQSNNNNSLNVSFDQNYNWEQGNLPNIPQNFHNVSQNIPQNFYNKSKFSDIVPNNYMINSPFINQEHYNDQNHQQYHNSYYPNNVLSPLKIRTDDPINALISSISVNDSFSNSDEQNQQNNLTSSLLYRKNLPNEETRDQIEINSIPNQQMNMIHNEHDIVMIKKLKDGYDKKRWNCRDNLNLVAFKNFETLRSIVEEKMSELTNIFNKEKMDSLDNNNTRIELKIEEKRLLAEKIINNMDSVECEKLYQLTKIFKELPISNEKYLKLLSKTLEIYKQVENWDLDLLFSVLNDSITLFEKTAISLAFPLPPPSKQIETTNKTEMIKTKDTNIDELEQDPIIPYF